MRQNVNLTVGSSPCLPAGEEITGENFSLRHLELCAEIMLIKLSINFTFHETPPKCSNDQPPNSTPPIIFCLLVVVTNTFKANEVNLRMDIKLVQDKGARPQVSCRAIQAWTSFELILKKAGRVVSLGLLLKTLKNEKIYNKFLKHTEDSIWYIITRKLNTK